MVERHLYGEAEVIPTVIVDSPISVRAPRTDPDDVSLLYWARFIRKYIDICLEQTLFLYSKYFNDVIGINAVEYEWVKWNADASNYFIGRFNM